MKQKNKVMQIIDPFKLDVALAQGQFTKHIKHLICANN